MDGESDDNDSSELGSESQQAWQVDSRDKMINVVTDNLLLSQIAGWGESEQMLKKSQVVYTDTEVD